MTRSDSCVAAVALGLLASSVWLPTSCHSYPTSPSDGAAAGATEFGPANATDAGAGGTPAESQTGGAAAESPTGGSGNAGRGGDTARGSDGDAGSGGDADSLDLLDPTSFPGVALWLEAAYDHCSVNDAEGHIEQCTDRSSHSNHAQQALADRRPTLTKTLLNGHATMHFESPDWRARSLVVADTESLRLAKRDFTVALVAAWTNSTGVVQNEYGGYGILLTKQASSAPFSGLTLLANYPGLAANHPTASRFAVQLDLDGSYALSASVKLNDSRFRLLVARRTGLELEVRVNGISQTRMQTESVRDISNEGYPLVIGGVDHSALSGDIAEVVLIGGAVPESKVGQLEAYFLQKYRL